MEKGEGNEHEKSSRNFFGNHGFGGNVIFLPGLWQQQEDCPR